MTDTVTSITFFQFSKQSKLTLPSMYAYAPMSVSALATS